MVPAGPAAAAADAAPTATAGGPSTGVRPGSSRWPWPCWPSSPSAGAPARRDRPSAVPVGPGRRPQLVPDPAGPRHGAARPGGGCPPPAPARHPDGPDHRARDRAAGRGAGGDLRVGAHQGPRPRPHHRLPGRGRRQRAARPGQPLRRPVRPDRPAAAGRRHHRGHPGGHVPLPRDPRSVRPAPASGARRREPSELTLGTASGGFLTPSGVVWVDATKIGAPLASASPPSITLLASEAPLAVDNTTLWALLLWLEALAVLLGLRGMDVAALGPRPDLDHLHRPDAGRVAVHRRPDGPTAPEPHLGPRPVPATTDPRPTTVPRPRSSR